MKKLSILLVITIFLSLSFTACNNMTLNQSDVTDYANNDNWLALPDSTDQVVDIFYLYPSAYFKTSDDEPNISNIDNITMRTIANGHFARQATAFETAGNIYAPYYRQVDATYCLSLPLNEQQEFLGGVIKADVFAAFDYYIKNYNNGRPYILAGHSQGSNVLLYLLSEYMENIPKYIREWSQPM